MFTEELSFHLTDYVQNRLGDGIETDHKPVVTEWEDLTSLSDKKIQNDKRHLKELPELICFEWFYSVSVIKASDEPGTELDIEKLGHFSCVFEVFLLYLHYCILNWKCLKTLVKSWYDLTEHV